MTIQFETTYGDPRGFRLTTRLLVAEPREEVFDFFADAYKLEAITPPWLRFSVQTPPPITMQQGTDIDYKLRLHGVPMRWRSTISLWEPPFQFADEQVKGPFKYWHHLHTFDRVDGTTLIQDFVHYGLPLRRLLQPLVRRDLRLIFEFRREALSHLFTPVAGP